MLGMSAEARVLFSAGGMRSHRMVTRCQLWRGGTPAAEPRVIGGSVAVDGDALIRRQATVTLDPTTVAVPRTPSDVLYPGAGEFLVWRGIDWRDGRAGSPAGIGRLGEELWPVGVFWHSRTEMDETGATTIVGYDRAKCVQRYAWLAPWLIPDNSSAVDTWERIVTDRFAGAVVDSSGVNDALIPAQLFGDRPEGDPWADADKIARLASAESYLSPSGTFLLRPVIDPQTLPTVAAYVEADRTDPGATTALVGVKRVLDAEEGYNIVAGEANTPGGTPLRSVVVDTNPASATYFGGDYRPAVRFLPGVNAATQADLDRITAATLAAKVGALDSVSVSLVVCPAHEAGDVIAVTRRATGVDGRYQLRSFSLPLGNADAMTAQVIAVTG